MSEGDIAIVEKRSETGIDFARRVLPRIFVRFSSTGYYRIYRLVPLVIRHFVRASQCLVFREETFSRLTEAIPLQKFNERLALISLASDFASPRERYSYHLVSSICFARPLSSLNETAQPFPPFQPRVKDASGRLNRLYVTRED